MNDSELRVLLVGIQDTLTRMETGVDPELARLRAEVEHLQATNTKLSALVFKDTEEINALEAEVERLKDLQCGCGDTEKEMHCMDCCRKLSEQAARER